MANETSLVDPRVSDTSPSKSSLALQYFPTLTDSEPERTDILEWISTVPYTNHHMRISDGRLKGSGEWILKKERYRTWRESTNSMLLLLRGIRKSPQCSTGRGTLLISSSSWSRQNIHSITGHRLVHFKSNSRIQVGILLLQSRRGKSARSREHSAHAYSAAFADSSRRRAPEAGPRCLQRTGEEGATLFAVDPKRMPGSPCSAYGCISSDDDLH